MESLIAILFCLAIQRFANVGSWFNVSWFENYLKRLHPWLIGINEWLGIGLIIAPVIILLGILNLLFHMHWFGLLNLILTITVLFCCLDARCSREHDSVKTILQHSFARIFPILFWFIAFGDFGIHIVVAYFMLYLIQAKISKVDAHCAGIKKASEQIKNALDWVPSRLLGFSYALAGNFNKGFAYWRKNLWLGLSDNSEFAIGSGIASLDDSVDSAQALALVDRVLVIWLIVIILVTIGSLL